MRTQVPIKIRPFAYKDTLIHWLIFVLLYSSWGSCNYSQCWLMRVSEPPFAWAALASCAFGKCVVEQTCSTLLLRNIRNKYSLHVMDVE